jgi:hypothetical protein
MNSLFPFAVSTIARAAELFGPRNEVIGQLTRLASVKPATGGGAAQAKVAQ